MIFLKASQSRFSSTRIVFFKRVLVFVIIILMFDSFTRGILDYPAVGAPVV